MKNGHYLKAGLHVIENNPNEIVPIFIREGSIIFYQITEGVTKTNQLGNSFTLITGMLYN